MSRLVSNSTGSERMRGAIFAENFESTQKVVANGGAVTSAPVIDFGMTTDGTDDVVTYPEAKLVKSISFWVTLTTTTENIMQLSSSHSIEAGSGTLTATGVTTPTFYVNGVATATIGTARSHVTITTATAFDADAIQIGQDASFGQFKIEELKMWNVVLDSQEALDFTNNSTYSYRNRAILDLPMDMKNHDPTNSQALDISKGARPVTPGVGVTKNKNIGYSISTRGMTSSATTGLFGDPLVSIVLHCVPNFTVGVDNATFWDTTAGSNYFLDLDSVSVRLYLGGTAIASMAHAVFLNSWNPNSHNVLIVTGDSTNNISNLYLNGVNIIVDDTTAWTAKDVSTLAVGDAIQTGRSFSGDLLGFQVYNFLLTGIQRDDILSKAPKQINKV